MNWIASTLGNASGAATSLATSIVLMVSTLFTTLCLTMVALKAIDRAKESDDDHDFFNRS